MIDYNSIKSAYLTDEEFIETQKILDETIFKSDLQIFRDHNGFRNGELHTFIGTKGAGKSTWAKTIISEVLYCKKRILLYISEEDTAKYVLAINKLFRRMVPLSAKEYLENVLVLSEMEIEIDTKGQFFEYVNEIIEGAEIDLFLFDNFTTAFLSELPIQEQSKLLREFKSAAKRHNIPVILFFHTSKNSNTKNLDGDNVRGSATAINVGSYNYVIHQQKVGDRIRNFVYTEKARYHNRSNKKVYEVLYNYELGVFNESVEISMNDYKEATKEHKW